MTLQERPDGFRRDLARRPEYLWLALALPAVVTVIPIAAGSASFGYAIGPTGEFGAALLVVALSIGPLRSAFPRSRLVASLLRRRRHIGVAAALYSVLHMMVFALAIGRFDHIVQGMAFASMWTGWIAFVLLVIVASVSNDRAMRALGQGWKRVQRLAYPAALLTLAHWLLLTRDVAEALIWFCPLAVLEAYRLWTNLHSRWRGVGR